MPQSPKNGLQPLRTRRSAPRAAPWGSRPKHQTSFLSVLCQTIDDESESNQEATLCKQWLEFKAKMRKRVELQSFVDSDSHLYKSDSFELCRPWLGQATSKDEPPQDVAPIQRPKTRFRGQVSLSSRPPEAPHGTCKLSVCSLNDSHFILLGGSEWDTELVKLSVNNSDLQVGAYGEKCFTFKIKSSLRSLVFVSVESREARDKWLSALSEKGVAVVGWDASLRCCQPSRCLASTTPVLSLKRSPSLVIWLS